MPPSAANFSMISFTVLLGTAKPKPSTVVEVDTIFMLLMPMT